MWPKVATSLSSSSHTAPNHLVTSIFCSTLRGFCSHCHLDRFFCRRIEATEHGLSAILSQGCEMRKESPLTPTRSTDYPCAVPKLLIVTYWTITSSSTDLQINLQYREESRNKSVLLPTGFLCFFLGGEGDFWFRQIQCICALQCHVFLYKEKGNVWLLQLPSPNLPLALPTCASSLQ